MEARTNGKQIRRGRLWCFGQSNYTLPAYHQSLIPARDWQQTSHGFRVHPFFCCLVRSLLILQFWTYRAPSIQEDNFQVSKCLDVHFDVSHMWCLWWINSLVLNFRHTAGLLGVNLWGVFIFVCFKILRCTKSILSFRITSTLEEWLDPLRFVINQSQVEMERCWIAVRRGNLNGLDEFYSLVI